MHPFPLVFLISQLLTSSAAAPLAGSSDTPSNLLVPRANRCYNAPNNVAGTPASRRGPSFPPEPASITWCDLHSSTYLIITATNLLLEASVSLILDDASLFVTQMIQRGGDGLIPRGFWTLEEHGLELSFANAGNHQQTWGVVGSALIALVDYYIHRVQVGSVRAIRFQVWDGRNLVGTGWLTGRGIGG